MELTNLIAEGKETKVYKNGDLAVKVFNADVPKTEVLNEALVHSLVEETGFKIPEIKEVSKIDGKWALSMTHIEGKTLRELMKENPDKMEEYVNLMVDVQLQLHARRIPTLPKLKYQLRSAIESLPELDDIRKYELLTKLESMPKHVKLCNASADVGKTYMLLCLQEPKAAEMYLDTFCAKSHTAKSYVQAWLPIIAAARLKEEKPEEKELLMRWLDVVDYD